MPISILIVRILQFSYHFGFMKIYNPVVDNIKYVPKIYIYSQKLQILKIHYLYCEILTPTFI